MVKRIKSENWRRELPNWTEKRKSSSSGKGIYSSNAKNAGKKEAEQDGQSSILLYDSCYRCPLSVYIDVVCDNKLSALIIQGNPSVELLEETKIKLISEFSELSNQSESKILINKICDLYRYEIQIRSFELALNLIAGMNFSEAVAFLNQNGLKCKAPENEKEIESLIKSIRVKIMNRTAKYKEAKTIYDSIKGKGETPTRKYFNKLLVMLSVCEIIKIQLNPEKMTVSEFAEYLNLYNEYQNQLRSTRYGSK